MEALLMGRQGLSFFRPSPRPQSYMRKELSVNNVF